MVAKDFTLARLPEEEKTITLSDLVFGEILEFERTIGPFTYYHCGVYAGNNMVIHKGTAYLLSRWQTLNAKWKHDIRYRIDRIEDVANGSRVYRHNMLDDVIFRPSEEVLKLRAMAMVGEADYDLFFDNCQHFCTKLRYGIPFSRQTDIFTIWTTFTSTKYDYTNEMVEVSLNLARRDVRRDVISKSFRRKEIFDLPDKGKLLGNKDHFVMTYNCTSKNYTNSSECQSSNQVYIHNTVNNHIPSKKKSKAITSSFKEVRLLNNGTNHYLFDTSLENQMPRTITSSSESQSLIFSTCITGILFLTQTSLTVTNTFGKRLISCTPACNSKGLENDISTQINIYMLIVSFLTVFIIFRRLFHW